MRDDSASDRVRIETIRAPRTSPLDATVPVTIVARTFGARGRTLDVTLSAGGAVVNRTMRPIESERSQLTLSLAPTVVGPFPSRDRAHRRHARFRDRRRRDGIRPTRWSVLFFDTRPSWMSTFVRRAIERDPRFVVTSRVVTSRNVSTDAGNPPNRPRRPPEHLSIRRHRRWVARSVARWRSRGIGGISLVAERGASFCCTTLRRSARWRD